MKSYLKWTFYACLLLTISIGISVIGEDIPEKKNIFLTLVIILIGALSIGLLFMFIEKIYLPFRTKKLRAKCLKLFKANEITPNVFHFKYEEFDVFLKLDVELKMSVSGGYIEKFEFHLKRSQIKGLKKGIWFKFKESHINSNPTFNVYGTNNLGLKLGWKRIRKHLDLRVKAKY